MRRTTLLLFLSLVGCDHATKRAAQVELKEGRTVPIVRGAVDLKYVENHGVAFSLERHLPPSARRPLALVAVSVGALGLLALALVWHRRPAPPLPVAAGYAFLAAGASGNLIERALRGHVIDFIQVHRWPVFNVADVYIWIGGGLLLLHAWRSRPRAPAPSSNA